MGITTRLYEEYYTIKLKLRIINVFLDNGKKVFFKKTGKRTFGIFTIKDDKIINLYNIPKKESYKLDREFINYIFNKVR